jgi:hypothetical protein
MGFFDAFKGIGGAFGGAAPALMPNVGGAAPGAPAGPSGVLGGSVGGSLQQLLGRKPAVAKPLAEPADLSQGAGELAKPLPVSQPLPFMQPRPVQRRTSFSAPRGFSRGGRR